MDQKPCGECGDLTTFVLCDVGVLAPTEHYICRECFRRRFGARVEELLERGRDVVRMAIAERMVLRAYEAPEP